MIGDQSFQDLFSVIEFYKKHFLDTTTLTEAVRERREKGGQNMRDITSFKDAYFCEETIASHVDMCITYTCHYNAKHELLKTCSPVLSLIIIQTKYSIFY